MSYNRKIFLSLLAIFFSTRLVILGISLAASNNFQPEPSSEPFRTHVRRLWSNFDVGWYKKVALEGYEQEPFSCKKMKNWGFLPLYPLVLGLLLSIFKGGSFFAIGSIFSSLCTIAALFLFAKTYAPILESKERFFFLYLISAGSFYFSIPYNEGFALLWMAITWHLTGKKQFLYASLAAGLGAITRIQLLALIAIPFIPLILKKETGKAIASFFVFCLPILIYMGYMHYISGKAIAYFDMQYAWGNTHPYPLESLFAFLHHGWNSPSQWIHLLVWILFGTCFARNYRSIPLSESIFCFTIFLISTSCEQFYGAYRYALLLTPLYVAFTNEKEWFRNCFIYFNLILGTFYIIAFVNDKFIVL